MITCGCCGCAVQASEAEAERLRSFGSEVVCESCFAAFADPDGTDCLIVPFPEGPYIPFNTGMWYGATPYYGPRVPEGKVVFNPIAEIYLLVDRSWAFGGE